MKPFTKALFTTERTSINNLNITDCSFILELVNSTGWITFIGDRNIHSEKDAGFYIQKILDNPDIEYWAVRLNENQTPIGIITFIKREYLDFHDIGFAFLPEYSNKGFAFEATQTVLNSLLNTKDYPIILATTIPSNSNSIKLLAKLSFKFDKEINVKGETLQVYSISKE